MQEGVLDNSYTYVLDYSWYHTDCLVRFGYEYFEACCERHHTEIVVINDEALSPEQEPVQDLMAILAVFAARAMFVLESDERCCFAKRSNLMCPSKTPPRLSSCKASVAGCTIGT